MQFLTRLLIVIGVLAGLGYGSYAFGKYVLSARLFGPQSGKSAATAKAGALQTPEVEVLPAPQPTTSGAGDDNGVPPTREPRTAATPDERVEISPLQSDANNDNGSASDNPRPRPTRRPRRKRRPRPTPRPTQNQSVPDAQSPVTAPPARTQNVDPPADNNAGNNWQRRRAARRNPPAPRDNRDTPAPAPTRRRERRIVPEAATPNVETPRTAPRREARPAPDAPPRNLARSRARRRIGRSRIDSPVPVPG